MLYIALEVMVGDTCIPRLIGCVQDAFCPPDSIIILIHYQLHYYCHYHPVLLIIIIILNLNINILYHL